MEGLKKDMQAGGYTLSLGKRTCIMGVLNVTPDSFSDGGKFMDPESALEHALELVASGADIIDIGGESSRPGSERVSEEEELDRVMPVIEALRGRIDVPLSIDTYKSEVARRAIAEGAAIVNDITALNGDPRMTEVIASSDAAVVLMHMKGNPGTMQDKPCYDDVVEEVCGYLAEALRVAEKAGIEGDRIILDPGIGFGKTNEHNLEILNRLGSLREIGRPVLVGTSRKAFIGEITGKDAGKREFGTAATVAAAIMNGADIVRVHDVADMKDVVMVTDAIRGAV